MWKLELEDYFFKIYDKNKDIAGYFDPDYGQIHSPETEYEQIQQMHKDASLIAGGFLVIPMVKFHIFDEKAFGIDHLSRHLEEARRRVDSWHAYVANNPYTHTITVSHTDPDMLSITLGVRFAVPVRLAKNDITCNLEPILDRLQRLSLL